MALICFFTASKKALAAAGSQMADYLMEQLAKKLSGNDVSSTSIEILVTGVDFMKSDKVEQVFGEITGVKNVTSINFSAPTARYQVDFSGSTSEFGRAISETDFGSFGVEITGKSANKLEMKIK